MNGDHSMATFAYPFFPFGQVSQDEQLAGLSKNVQEPLLWSMPNVASLTYMVIVVACK